MKTNLNKGNRFLLKFHAAVVAATLLGGAATVSHGAAFDLPTGTTWDCVVSGSRNGLAYITFSGDNTGGNFSGWEILVPKVKTSTSNERGGTSGRFPGDDTGGGTNNSVQLFGDQPISGTWGFDTKGRVVGFFSEDVTNSVGFTATVSQGNRITMLAGTPFGKVNFRGKPAVPLIDFGVRPWNGFKKQGDQSFVEIFGMNLAGGPGPNFYTITGNGGGYSYSGIAIISVQKKIAFSLDLGVNGRATFGSFNPSKVTGKTKGWDQPSGDLKNPATFNVEQQPPPVP